LANFFLGFEIYFWEEGKSGNGNRRSPPGMTTRKARATAKARKARATAKAKYSIRYRERPSPRRFKELE
jgi:hypothetical protein